MVKHYFTYDPVEFHYNGHIILEDTATAPENSTELPVPMCDGDRFAKWEEDKWVVKHLVDGEWVNCTDTLPVVSTEEVTPPPYVAIPGLPAPSASSILT
jgi:hypothetical protein